MFSSSKKLFFLVLPMGILAAVAALGGICSSGGDGPWEHLSVRGETVSIYGKGIYRHMSAEVAPQGIAQDVVTLLLGVPFLSWSFWKSRHGGEIRHGLLLGGAVLYILVTYTFYLAMGTYNAFFLLYAALAGMGAFALILTLSRISLQELFQAYQGTKIHRAGGAFLIFSALAVGLLWLGIILPPLFSGSVIPSEVAHYTTLIVQGFDLAFLLPISFVLGVQLFRCTPLGLLGGTVYLVFLSLMMMALSAKVAAMGILGYNVIPVVYIIPSMALGSLGITWRLVRSFSKPQGTPEVSEG